MSDTTLNTYWEFYVRDPGRLTYWLLERKLILVFRGGPVSSLLLLEGIVRDVLSQV